MEWTTSLPARCSKEAAIPPQAFLFDAKERAESGFAEGFPHFAAERKL